MPDMTDIGHCDNCDVEYKTYDAHDHDTETGLCWSCSPNDFSLPYDPETGMCSACFCEESK